MRLLAQYCLRKELRKAGAHQAELSSLLVTANTLRSVKQPQLSDTTMDRIASIAGGRRWWPKVTVWSLGGSFAVFALLVVSAQFASPGSPLYGLRRGTEEVRAWIQPGYKETLVEIRLHELQQLEEAHAAPEVIKDAVDAYRQAIDSAETKERRIEGDVRHENNSNDTENRERHQSGRRDWNTRNDTDEDASDQSGRSSRQQESGRRSGR